jgi:hypothetical protein
MRHQVRKAVGARADARFAVPIGRAEAAGESAHRPGEIRFSVELEDDLAQSGFGSPRPRAGRVGEVANLYGHVLDKMRNPLMPLPAGKTPSKDPR